MSSVCVEEVTPMVAKELLGLNNGNFRKVDKNRVLAYAKAMKNGKWKLNGATIVTNGTMLLDGQHRLLAVIKSGVTIRSIVVRGLDADAMTIDRGKPRSIAQWLSHSGYKNCNALASAARLCIAHDNGLWGNTSVQLVNALDSEVVDFVAANNDNLQASILLSSVTRQFVPVSVMAAVLFLGTKGCDPRMCDTAVWFVEGLSTGTSLSDDDAVLHLRNRILGQSPGRKITVFMKRCLTTIAWNKTVAGDACSSKQLMLKLTGPSKQEPPKAVLTIDDPCTF